MNYKIRFIDKIFWLVIFVWSIVIFIFILATFQKNYNSADLLALTEAQTNTKKDLAYRSWIASHGGVYVPITKKTLPSPYLIHIANRDIETTNGFKLTLMNPAYTLSQIMEDYAQLYGVKGHITSKILLNPNNKPDAWELKALTTVEITREPVSEKSIIDDKLYYRYLKPLIVQQSCLKCHAFQGYKIGDIRGGVSIAIPMDSYEKQAVKDSLFLLFFTIPLWLFGITLIIFGRKKAKIILLDKIKDYEQNIYSLVMMIEKRDRFTAGHSQRVAKYASLIAKEMSYDKEVIDELYKACILHDIGKISTPDSILLKPGILTPTERNIIEDHVVVGYEILKNIDIYHNIAEIMRHHHESFDGSGYPQGLKGDEIPLLSQIISVADAFDAMTTDRIYQEKLSVDKAITQLENSSGKQFHHIVVDAAKIVFQDVVLDNSITQAPQSILEQERFSYFYKDQVVDGYNIEYLSYILKHNSLEEYRYNHISIVYLHNFSQYNKIYSWKEGNKLLYDLAKELNSITSKSILFRIHGDDFILLTKEYIELETYKDDFERYFDKSGIVLSYDYFNINKNKINGLDILEELVNI